MSGIYAAEYAGTRLAYAVRFAADTLNGVPSIVIGVFVYSIAVLPFRRFSALAGGLALGVMMIPLIMRTTEELLLLVPSTLREGALALGATRARAVFTVVVPAALPGILTGILLALARIAGETAPLLFTALNNRFFSTDPAADLDADRSGLHLRHRALRGLAPPGVGRRPGAGRHGAYLLAARPRRHRPDGEAATGNVRVPLGSTGFHEVPPGSVPRGFRWVQVHGFGSRFQGSAVTQGRRTDIARWAYLPRRLPCPGARAGHRVRHAVRLELPRGDDPPARIRAGAVRNGRTRVLGRCSGRGCDGRQLSGCVHDVLGRASGRKRDRGAARPSQRAQNARAPRW